MAVNTHSGWWQECYPGEEVVRVDGETVELARSYIYRYGVRLLVRHTFRRLANRPISAITVNWTVHMDRVHETASPLASVDSERSHCPSSPEAETRSMARGGTFEAFAAFGGAVTLN